MSLRLVIVDAFTDRPFAGNPAAVCLLTAPAPEAWMQQVAAEMNLSETAFVQPTPSGSALGLRWFTPKVEVDLCGHATLATAHVLWEQGVIAPGQAAEFTTRSGRLTAVLRDGWIELDFPSKPVTTSLEDPEELSGLARALRSEVVAAHRNEYDLLVELADERTVRGLTPDIAAVAAFPARGVITTARSSDPRFDFVSRFFAPRVGIDEDPVCGSAHCCLGPYWGAKLSRAELTGHQVSPRGGIVRVRMAGNRTALIGKAVTVVKGEIAAG